MTKSAVLFLSILCSLFTATAMFAADDKPGYTDTPLLPKDKNGIEWRVHAQERPQPPAVQPGSGDLGTTPPNDAVILFDGKNLDAWKCVKKDATVSDGVIDVLKTGGLTSKEEFGDCQLHIEWRTPVEKADRMNWGNSGIFLMDKYELQIIESHDSFIYADGNSGAIYGQTPALVNPARKPGEWQSFDIVFTTPKYKDGKMLAPPYITVSYNGVVVQNHTEILGATLHKTLPGKHAEKETGVISLQEHHSGVQFRNIWIRKL